MVCRGVDAEVGQDVSETPEALHPRRHTVVCESALVQEAKSRAKQEKLELAPERSEFFEVCSKKKEKQCRASEVLAIKRRPKKEINFQINDLIIWGPGGKEKKNTTLTLK